ncbi:MAG: HAD family phosphatase [Synergistaceae bacterium]|nr:HAD family phosphatase [Synergistaceae bacterium]
MTLTVSPPFWHPAFSKGFILDWDGVLAETKLNFTPIREKYFGGEFVPLLEAARSLPPELRKELNRDIYNLEMAGAETSEVVPGALDLLEWLGAQKKPWCVVSRNCRDSILLAARRCGLPLPPVVKSRDDPPVKPEPEALWNAALSLGVPFEKCLMVGDFLYDLVGARRAGMRAVLVQRPCAEWKHWADLSFDRLTDFVVSLKTPMPFVPWEYASLAEELGAQKLSDRASQGVLLSGKDPLILRKVLSLAERGILLFAVEDEGSLSAEQWRNMPGIPPALLDQPVALVLQSLLRFRYPLAKVADAVDGHFFLREGEDLDRLLGKMP